MRLSNIAYYVVDNISSDSIELNQYITTDNLLQNKEGRATASNLPPQVCSLTHFLPGDVLIANIRPYLKKVWKADIEGGCSKDVLVLRAKEGHNSDYLYAVALQDVFFENAMLGSKGTKMPRGDRDKIMELPLFEQNDKESNIGQFINEVQDKIALNTRMNAELEAMAKQLYDYWFVQFDFPDKNGKPYKSSGGKMVWDDKLKRVIPEGWEVKTLEKIENIIVTGKTPSTSDDKNFNGDIPFITIDDIRNNLYINTTSRTLSFKGAELQRNKYIPENTLCCSCIGTPGIIGFTSKLSQTNQQINSIIFKNEKNREFIFFSLKMIFSLSTAKTGNILPNMNKNEFSNIILVYPSSEILSIFHEIVSPLFDKIKNNCSETCRLTHLRDSLLPMLMNGQVIIK